MPFVSKLPSGPVVLDRAAILRLIPHQGRMCLLERVAGWDAGRVRCLARSHLDPANPLRRHGILPAVAGIEYGLQAAALHGALIDGEPTPPGLLASLRAARFACARLDEAAIGTMSVTAQLLAGDARAMRYEFTLLAEDGRTLASGEALIAFAAPGGTGGG